MEAVLDCDRARANTPPVARGVSVAWPCVPLVVFGRGKAVRLVEAGAAGAFVPQHASREDVAALVASVACGG